MKHLLFLFYPLSKKSSFAYTVGVKKFVLFLILMVCVISLNAADFPHYDFTFYTTKDETLTAFNRDDLGIDVTGYGFIGAGAKHGIYLRIGIQTPLKTLLQLTDELLSRLQGGSAAESSGTSTPEEDNSSSDSTSPADTSTTTPPVDTSTPAPAVDTTTPSTDTSTSTPAIDTSTTPSTGTSTTVTTPEDTTTAVPPADTPDIDTPSAGTAAATPETDIPAAEDTSITIDDDDTIPDDIELPDNESSIDINHSDSGEKESVETRKTAANSTEWKFLLSIGPAYRSTMGPNAFVYAGFGLTSSAKISHRFTESGAYTSSFFIIFSSDIDLGFKVQLEYTKTSIRIGFHSITNIIGYSNIKTYDKNNVKATDSVNLYGYLAGKYGVMGATKARGYIRLATTISDNRTDRYNYSNTTPVTGKGKLTRVE